MGYSGFIIGIQWFHYWDTVVSLLEYSGFIIGIQRFWLLGYSGFIIEYSGLELVIADIPGLCLKLINFKDISIKRGSIHTKGFRLEYIIYKVINV